VGGGLGCLPLFGHAACRSRRALCKPDGPVVAGNIIAVMVVLRLAGRSLLVRLLSMAGGMAGRFRGAFMGWIPGLGRVPGAGGRLSGGA